jgi:DNA-binding NarL/FixJ family response regulator
MIDGVRETAMSDQRVRVGVVAASPLAAWGLVGILEQVLPVEAVTLSTEALLEGSFASDRLAAVVFVSSEDLKGSASAEAVKKLCSTVGRLRRRRPALKIVVVGGPLHADDVQKVIGAGAKGYLVETANESEIRMAMEVVMDGSIWAPRKVLARLIDESAAVAAVESTADELSAREHEVLNLLMNGRSNREIAAALGIEQATVKAHLGRMLRKTKSRNRLEMTLRIMEEMEARQHASPAPERNA